MNAIEPIRKKVDVTMRINLIEEYPYPVPNCNSKNYTQIG